MRLTVSLLITALLTPALAGAQSGAIKSGVRGRVVIADKLQAATVWPLDEDAANDLRRGARVRRPTGHGAPAPLLAPKPALLIALEGARAKDAPAPAAMELRGLRFAPAETLLLRGQTLTLTNRQGRPLTLELEDGESLGALADGKAKDIQLDPGEHVLRIKEIPFARAKVKVLGKATLLPVSGGEIEATTVEGGEYQITFYHGARALQSQTLNIPDDKYVAIDASVSDLGVVTVSIKDGGLQVAVPPPSPPPPPPPPKRQPKPKPKPKPKPAVEEIPLEDLED